MEKLKLNTCYFNIVAFRLTKVLVINASKEGITTFLARYGKYEIPPQIIPIQDLYCQERFWYPKEVIQNPNVTPSDPTPYCALKAHGPHRIPQSLHIRFITDTNDSLIFSPSITEHGFTDEKVTLTMNLQGWKQFLKMLTHLHDNSTWFYVTIPQPSWKHLPFQLTAPDKNYPNEIIFNAIECIRLDPKDKVFFIANAFQENFKAPIYVRVLGTPSGLLWLANWITTFIKSTKEEEYFHNTWIIPPIDRDTTYAEHSI
ncbi:MAG: hypothetical protein P4L16_00490, partial [Chlamydiales bacterium]|nr:hypothetical protein [Chlamydiales bacterium]